MRRLSGALFLASFGLVVGCGDDGDPKVTASGGSTGMTSLPPLTTSETDTGTATGTTAPTTSDGTGSGSVTETASSSDTGTASTGEPTSTSTSTTNAMTSSTSNMTTMTTMTGSTTDTPCQELMVTLKPVKPNTMLVLDKSASMLQLWDHDANNGTPNVTRWFSLWAVVDQILTGFNDSFNFGMNLFPSSSAQAVYGPNGCLVNDNMVEVAVAPMNKDAIIAALPAQGNMSIAGGTPTARGMEAALEHLKTLDPAVPRVVILVTDGAANCSTSANTNMQLFEVYDANLAGIVGDAYTVDQIPTYVIGIAIANALTGGAQDGNPDNINPYEKLNELATLGGTAKMGAEKFYSADNQIELEAALNDIVSAAFSCVIELESPPAFPDKTEVVIGGMKIPKVTDCASENGWAYVEPEPYGAIQICGTACDELKIAGDADINYYCDAG